MQSNKSVFTGIDLRRRNMKRHTLLRILSAIMCFVLAVGSLCLPAFAEKSNGKAATRSEFTSEDMLHTKGKKIYNERGEEVVLRGVNLGGWLINESWMTPVENSEDNITTLNILTERFGQDKAYELINTYQDNWITEYDLDYIAELGFNCVRVPFWFRNFYYDDKGTKILDESGNWDFSRLDWIVSECSKRGLYVILDMHGAPGYQNAKDHCGKVGDCGLFKMTSQAEEWRTLTVELWVAIATRFSGNPAVAMYDLLNEPNCDVTSYLEKNNIMTISVYNRLYKAIREVDPDHIMTMEGIWRLYNLPAPWFIGWTNVVYQLHLYNNSNLEFRFLVFFAKLYPYNVPLYIGEFKPAGSATWDCVLGLFNDSHFSWTVWSYKGFGYGADTSDWFIVGSKTGDGRADIKNDDFETIKTKWGSAMRTDGNFVNTGLYNSLKDFV